MAPHDRARSGIKVDKPWSGGSPFSSAKKGVPSSGDISRPHGAGVDPGLGKIQNSAAWGESMASQRYGGGTRVPKQTYVHDNKPQKLGDPNNLQGPDYDNDTKEAWLHGAASAESREGYAPSFRSPPGSPGYQGARSVDEQGHELRVHSAHRRPHGSNNMGSRGRTPRSDLSAPKDTNATRGRR
jgi:hypothetical protein